MECPRPWSVRPTALEADGQVHHHEGQPRALLVHHAVEQLAEIHEHDLSLRVVVLVVAELQDREDALRGRGWVAASVTVARRADVDHVVAATRQSWLVPRRERK